MGKRGSSGGGPKSPPIGAGKPPASMPPAKDGGEKMCPKCGAKGPHTRPCGGCGTHCG